jgi:hypothetical protein
MRKNLQIKIEEEEEKKVQSPHKTFTRVGNDLIIQHMPSTTNRYNPSSNKQFQLTEMP